MTKPDCPVTSAIRVLREKGIPFEPLLYRYEEHGGTAASAAALRVDEHSVVKTLVMETDSHSPLLVLMHGDREVSTKNLARQLGVKSIQPCSAQAAERYTGYLFGGTSPFGTRHPLPVFVERSILALPAIYINGGKRGFLIRIAPPDLRKALDIVEVDVAVSDTPV